MMLWHVLYDILTQTCSICLYDAMTCPIWYTNSYMFYMPIWCYDMSYMIYKLIHVLYAYMMLWHVLYDILTQTCSICLYDAMTCPIWYTNSYMFYMPIWCYDMSYMIYKLIHVLYAYMMLWHVLYDIQTHTCSICLYDAMTCPIWYTNSYMFYMPIWCYDMSYMIY